jgi:hypothetical protein
VFGSSLLNITNVQCPSSLARTLKALTWLPSSDTTAGNVPSLSTLAHAATEKLLSASTACGALIHIWLPSSRAARSDESGMLDWPAV